MSIQDPRFTVEKHSKNVNELFNFTLASVAAAGVLGLIFATLEIIFPSAVFNTFFLGSAVMAAVSSFVMLGFALKELNKYEKALDETSI